MLDHKVELVVLAYLADVDLSGERAQVGFHRLGRHASNACRTIEA
jgi:hypothetical protein